MDATEVLRYLDELVFAQTGKHLDSLQRAILKGVLNGQKYADIAKEYQCTRGHAKDEAYALWQILSEALGENLNKSNFRASVERLGVDKSQYKSQIIGHYVIGGNINHCSNPPQVNEKYEAENLESISRESPTPVTSKDDNIETERKLAKLETIPRLVKIGLTAEQIAQALHLSLEEVEQKMR
jgi:DNA-directed RNA polymerase specialized sigma24 family protein